MYKIDYTSVTITDKPEPIPRKKQDKALLKFMLGDFYDESYLKLSKDKSYKRITKLPPFKFKKLSE
jgi:hypothetical protein